MWARVVVTENWSGKLEYRSGGRLDLRNQNDSRGLRKLRGEADYDDWAMAAQARLGKRGLWDVVTVPRPARRELASYWPNLASR